jgi:hypothetical protein
MVLNSVVYTFSENFMTFPAPPKKLLKVSAEQLPRDRKQRKTREFAD